MQDIAQLMVIAVLSGLFWLQKAQDDTLLSARNTIGELACWQKAGNVGIS